MEPTITPEPTAAERAAIREALRRNGSERAASPWWRAGLAEALAEGVHVQAKPLDDLDITAPSGP